LRFGEGGYSVLIRIWGGDFIDFGPINSPREGGKKGKNLQKKKLVVKKRPISEGDLSSSSEFESWGRITEMAHNDSG